MTEDIIRDARIKYAAHKHNIRKKTDINGDKVEMLLSFDQWFEIWWGSGHWFERGRGSGQYVMAREGDVGHYELGNVEIILGAENKALALSRRNISRTGTTLGPYNISRTREEQRSITQKRLENYEPERRTLAAQKAWDTRRRNALSRNSAY